MVVVAVVSHTTTCATNLVSHVSHDHLTRPPHTTVLPVSDFPTHVLNRVLTPTVANSFATSVAARSLTMRQGKPSFRRSLTSLRAVWRPFVNS